MTEALFLYFCGIRMDFCRSGKVQELKLRENQPEENKGSMKKIEAIIRLSQFEQVRDALANIGVRFFTLMEVKGFGLQKGAKLVYRGSVYDSDYIGRLQLDILCRDDQVKDIIKVITESGRTGEVGDGKIVVLDVQSVTRIRTGETGADAI